MPDMEPGSMEHYYQDDEYPEEVFSVCAVPGNDQIKFRISTQSFIKRALSPDEIKSFLV